MSEYLEKILKKSDKDLRPGRTNMMQVFIFVVLTVFVSIVVILVLNTLTP